MNGERAALLIMDVEPEIVERFGDSGLTERLAPPAYSGLCQGRFPRGISGDQPAERDVLTDRRAGRVRRGRLQQRASGTRAAAGRRDRDQAAGERVSGSDLDAVLRAGGIEALVLGGIATSGVVLSTLRQAADLDFSLTVLSDGCIDADREVHRVLCEKVFPRQAQVLSVSDWIDALP